MVAKKREGGGGRLEIDSDVVPVYKGKPYLDAVPLVFSNLLLIPLAVVVSLLRGGVPEVRHSSIEPIGTRPAKLARWQPLPCDFAFFARRLTKEIHMVLFACYVKHT